MQISIQQQKVKMSNIQSKIIRHTKRLENLIPNQEKYCSIKTDPNITQSIKFSDKYDKTAIINRFHMLMQVKENMNVMRRGVKAMKYSQVKFLKIKNIYVIKNTLDGIH